MLRVGNLQFASEPLRPLGCYSMDQEPLGHRAPHQTGLPSFMLVYNEFRAELYLAAIIFRLGSFVGPSLCEVDSLGLNSFLYNALFHCCPVLRNTFDILKTTKGQASGGSQL